MIALRLSGQDLEIVSKVLEQPALFSALLTHVADAARANWIRLAQTQLNTSRRDYIAGIQPVTEDGPNERVIELVGWLANAVETGLDPYDLRRTLLNERAKVSKATGARYRVIPFRAATPGTVGAVAPAMGNPYARRTAQQRTMAPSTRAFVSDAHSLGKNIYKHAKKLKGNERLPEGLAPKLQPWHSTDIYAGMQRTARAGHAQYTTFRVISDNVQRGWLHPGIEARNLAQQVERNITGMMDAIVTNALKPLSGD